MRHYIILATALAAAAGLALFGSNQEQPAAPEPSAVVNGVPLAAKPALLAGALPVGHPPIDGAGAEQLDHPVAGGSTLTGKVRRVEQVSRYSYLLLASDDGEHWVAVPRADVAVGADVRVVDAVVMTDFASPSLGRSFERIHFGVLGERAVAPAAGAAAPEPLANELTVALVHAQAVELEGKRVVLRGEVTKSTAGVLGRTWLHLRDGSGIAGSGHDDLVVTTSGSAEVGAKVRVVGKLVRDRDLGSGYRYDVLIEDAEVTLLGPEGA